MVSDDTDARDDEQDAGVERCPQCGKTFEADSTGRENRTELNLGKPAGYCSLSCRLDAEAEGGSA